MFRRKSLSRVLAERRACYRLATPRIKTNALGETNIPKVRQHNERASTMGDRSPKSVQKQASQKQSKSNVSNQKKQALITSQQATKAKAAANKKK
jgi:Rieske Fe-S protein